MKEILFKFKTISKDFGYNILATVIVTAILQVLAYPYMAACFSTDEYGLMLTVVGVANVIIIAIGGGLNNVRLIQQNIYQEKNMQGDFNILIGIFGGLSTLLFAGLAFIQFRVSGWHLFFITIYVLLGIIENYWMVSYRIVIDYKKNLIYNLFLSVGYVAGLGLSVLCRNWTFVFVIGYMFGLIYLIRTSNLFHEPFRVTPIFPKTLRVYCILIVTNMIANIVIYLDRFILYPLLGGEQVTIYTVSSFVGKSIGLVVTPMASVLLSYYSKKDFRMTVQKYWRINFFSVVGGMMVGGAAICIAPWITGLLYPTVIGDAREYLVIANVAAMIGALANIVSPSVLKFANIMWQIIIQAVYAVVYVGLGYFLLKYQGLWGFCIVTIVVNLIRMAMLMVAGHMGIKMATQE